MEASSFSQVKIASACIILYALVVLGSALWNYYVNDVADTYGLIKAVVRALGMSGLAIWILFKSKISWFFAVGACGVLSLVGVIALGAFALLPIPISEIGGFVIIQLGVSLIALIAATVILVKKDVRQLFV